MKQLFYAVAVIILLFFAIRLMSKVKDIPEEEPYEESDEELDEKLDEETDEESGPEQFENN
jgi:Na+-transporting methylmalonyl-CoA/oxaloacetate decarboxylase gamma subunit